jgi:hypothetical protein
MLTYADVCQPQKCVVEFHDPLVGNIGSIALDGKNLITFGNPQFSVWQRQAQSNFTLWYHDPLFVSKLQLDLDPFYKNDGAFMQAGILTCAIHKLQNIAYCPELLQSKETDFLVRVLFFG